jgi:DNA-binding NarL/FixJ family response regulator
MPIRILLAQLPRSLQESLERVLSEDPDMLVVLVENYMEVLLVARESRADVVVIGMEDAQPPGIVSRLLDEDPSLRIIVVEANSQQGFLYQLRPELLPIGDVSSLGFRNVIRAVVQDQEDV